jgi:hypothetical protein
LTDHHLIEGITMTTTRYARPPNADRGTPARVRRVRPADAGSRCRCIATNGTSTASLRHLAPIRDGVDGVID